MTVFQLADGTKLVCAINVNVIKSVRDKLGIDLGAIFESEVLQKLYSDPVLLVDTIYLCCEQACEKAGLTDVEFGEALGDGETIAIATAALLEAIVNFTPPGRRPPLIAAINKLKVIEDKQTSLAMERINSPVIDQIMTNIHREAMEGLEAMARPPQPKSGEQSTNVLDESE